MVAKVFVNQIKLLEIKIIIGQNIVYTKCGSECEVCAPNAERGSKKCILPIFSDMEISVAIGYIVEVATNNRRIRRSV